MANRRAVDAGVQLNKNLLISGAVLVGIGGFLGATGLLLGSTAVALGQGVYLSDLYRLLQDVEGVDHVDLTRVTRRPQPRLEVWSGDAQFGEVTVRAATQAGAKAWQGSSG